MPSNPPSPGRPRKVSRRQFARDVALAGATAALLPSTVLAQQGSDAPAAAEQLPAAAAADFAKLSPASQAEVEAKYQTVLRRYGARLSAAQKTEARRQLIVTQKGLDLIRAFPLENSNPPATIFRVYRRPAAARRKPAAAGKP